MNVQFKHDVQTLIGIKHLLDANDVWMADLCEDIHFVHESVLPRARVHGVFLLVDDLQRILLSRFPVHTELHGCKVSTKKKVCDVMRYSREKNKAISARLFLFLPSQNFENLVMLSWPIAKIVQRLVFTILIEIRNFCCKKAFRKN